MSFADISAPGISRKRLAAGWGYYWQGKRIGDGETIHRLDALGLPPAYERCWFCADPAGHIQAIGYDRRGRRQYRYHSRFRSKREHEKFDRCAPFGQALTSLRRQIDHDLGRRVYDKITIVAAIVHLLDVARLRIGGRQYARENGSFGATTLRKQHAQVSGEHLKLQFRAKSDKDARYVINDRVLARVVRRCQELPGQALFSYRDEAGEPCAVSSQDVNAYIKDAMGADFTAKDFRTWGASLIAYEVLSENTTQAPAGATFKLMLETVAEALGNTPAMARKAYIHPRLLAMAKDGTFVQGRGGRATRYLSRAERGLIALLETTARTAQ